MEYDFMAKNLADMDDFPSQNPQKGRNPINVKISVD